MRIAGPATRGAGMVGLAVGLVAATAAEPDAKTKSPYAALIAEIVPDDAPARPPFQRGAAIWAFAGGRSRNRARRP